MTSNKNRNIEEQDVESEPKYKYHAYFKSALDGIVLINYDTGQIVDCNPEFENQTGRTLRQLKKLKIWELRPKDIQDMARKKFIEIKKKGKGGSRELDIEKTDGTIVPIEFVSKIIEINEKKFLQSITRDISDRKMVEDALKESEEKHRTLFETMAQGVVYQDAKGNIISANPSAEQILGLSFDQMTGRTSMDPRWMAIHEDGSKFPGESHPSMIALKTGKAIRNVIMGVVNPKKKDYTWININAVPQFRKSESKPYQVYTTFEDITERKKSEELILMANERLKYLLTSSSAVIYTAKPSGDFGATFISENVQELVGYKAKDFIETSDFWFNHVHPDDQGAITEEISHIFEKDFHTFDYRFKNKDGTYIWVQDEMKLVRDKAGKPIEIIGVWLDITERKHAEEALRESEEKFRSMVENSSDIIMIVDSEANVKFISSSVANILGHEPNSIVGNCAFDYCHPDDLDYILDAFTKVVRSPQTPITIELRVQNKGGDWYSVVATANNFLGTPEIGGVIVNFHDITERMHAEEALRESEEKFRLLFENAAEGIVYLDSNGIIIDANPKAFKISGYDREDIIGKNFMDLIPMLNLDPNLIENEFNRLLEGKSLADNEWKIKNKNGQESILSVHPSLIRKNEKIIGLSVVFEDITNRKEAKEKLIESEKKLRLFIDSSPDLFFLKDKNLNYTLVNKANAEFFGKNELDIIDKNDFDLMPKEAANGCRDSDNQAIAKKETIISIEEADGHIYETRKVPVISNDEVIGIAGIVRDITESSKAKEKIVASEERYKGLVEKSGVGVASSDIDGNFIYVNNILCEMIGYSKEELLGKPFIDFIYPDDQDYILETFMGAFEDPDTQKELEFRVTKKNGELIYLYSKPTIIINNGEITGFNAIINDITDRKLTEDALRESEEKFRSLAEKSPNMIFINKKGKVVYVNEKCVKAMGYTKEEFYSSDFNIISIVTPETFKVVMAAHEKHKIGEDVPPYEYTLVTKDGKQLDAINATKIINYEGGSALLGVVTDITNRKAVERALRESEDKFSKAFYCSPNLLAITTLENGKIVDINETFTQVMGYTRKEAIGHSTIELGMWVNEKDREDFKKELKIKGQVKDKEIQAKTKPGELRYLQLSGEIINLKGNQPHLITIANDITERKLAEEQIIYQANLVENVSDAIISTDMNFNIKSWNKAAENIFGWSSNEVIGKNVGEITKIEYRDTNNNETIERFMKHEYWKGEVIQKSKEGAPLNILSSVSLVKDMGGNPIGAVAINRDITKRKKAEDVIRKSEERFRNLFENSPIPLREENFSKLKKHLQGLDAKGKKNLRRYFKNNFDKVKKCANMIEIIDVNEANLNLYGIQSKNVFKENLFKTFNNESYKVFIDELINIANGGINFEAETEILTLEGDTRHIRIKWHAAPGYEETLERVLVTIIDITEQKRKEEEMKKNMMKYRLDDGNLYLVKEQTAGILVEAFNDIMKVGYPGIAISRMFAHNIRPLLKHEYKFLWLAERGGEGTINPKVGEIEKYMEKLTTKSAIMIDRLDYLISKNGFKKTLDFVHNIKEIAFYHNHIIIISIDPVTLEDDKLRQLEKECLEIQTREQVRLHDDLMEILSYIQKQNFLGLKPSFTDIEDELNLSKPTVRKRVSNLMGNGYVNVSIHGRTKVVELSEKSRRLF